MATVSASVDSLVAVYSNVIETYSLSWIDYWLEGSSLSNYTAVDLRNQALRKMQDSNQNVRLSYTLPVMPTGLTADGLYALQSSLLYGVRVDSTQFF